MIERILTTRVANGYVIQIKCVGIATETTFVCMAAPEGLGKFIEQSVEKVLEDKL